MDVRLTPYHPFRDVNWRYEKSRDRPLRNGRPTWHLGEDPWKDQFRFLKRLVCCKNDHDRSRLMHESAAHWFAFELYCDSESGLRAIVEARLLAEETFSSIGARLGLTGSVIETYGQCYFDVRSRLSHVDFIHSHVLSRNAKSNKGRSEWELALKRIGYCAGAKALDRVLRTPGRPADSATANSTIQGLADHVEDLLFDKFLTAIGRTEDTDEKVVRSLTQVHAQLVAVRQNSSESSSGSEDYIRNVEAMLDAIPWRLATKGLPKEFDKWKHRATELRAEEMMLVTSGMGGPNEKDMKLRILPAGADPKAAPKG